MSDTDAADLVEECGRVVAIGEDGVWVETLARTGCGRCDEPGGCGRNTISRLFGKRHRHVLARTTLALEPGEGVVIGIPPGVILRASLMLYLVPLLGLVGGAVFGQGLQPEGGELASILLGMAGLAGGFLFARSWSLRVAHEDGWLPVVVRRLPVAAPTVVRP